MDKAEADKAKEATTDLAMTGKAEILSSRDKILSTDPSVLKQTVIDMELQGIVWYKGSWTTLGGAQPRGAASQGCNS